jgi:hypothetical protein
MRRLVAAALLVMAAAAAGLAPGAPATASHGGTGSWLQVTIGAPTTPGPSDRTEPIVAWLTCDPAGGNHPFAAEACADLTAAGGDIAAIAPIGGCGGVSQPVEITAWGRWQGQPVLFIETADNDGCARISHGLVFRI